MTDYNLPPDVPTWVTLLFLLAGWLAANVWPVLKDALNKKFGIYLDTERARSTLDLELKRRQLDLDEKRNENEKALADVMRQMSMLVEQNIEQTREMKTLLMTLSTTLTTSLATLPTARDVQTVVQGINELKAMVQAWRDRE